MFYLRKQLKFCDTTAGFDDRGTSAEISSDDATIPGCGMGSVSDWLKFALSSVWNSSLRSQKPVVATRNVGCFRVSAHLPPPPPPLPLPLRFKLKSGVDCTSLPKNGENLASAHLE